MSRREQSGFGITYFCGQIERCPHPKRVFSGLHRYAAPFRPIVRRRSEPVRPLRFQDRSNDTGCLPASREGSSVAAPGFLLRLPCLGTKRMWGHPFRSEPDANAQSGSFPDDHRKNEPAASSGFRTVAARLPVQRSHPETFSRLRKPSISRPSWNQIRPMSRADWPGLRSGNCGSLCRHGHGGLPQTR